VIITLRNAFIDVSGVGDVIILTISRKLYYNSAARPLMGLGILSSGRGRGGVRGSNRAGRGRIFFRSGRPAPGQPFPQVVVFTADTGWDGSGPVCASFRSAIV